jgi:hypothetical protein
MGEGCCGRGFGAPGGGLEDGGAAGVVNSGFSPYFGDRVGYGGATGDGLN